MQPFVRLPIFVDHPLFYIEQIDHTLPVKSLSDLPDVTLQAIAKDGAVHTGHFKITVNDDQKAVWSYQLVSEVVEKQLKEQLIEHGYFIPAPPVEQPGQYSQVGFNHHAFDSRSSIGQMPNSGMFRGDREEFLRGLSNMMYHVRESSNVRNHLTDVFKGHILKLNYSDGPDRLALQTRNGLELVVVANRLDGDKQFGYGRNSLSNRVATVYLEQTGTPMTGCIFMGGVIDYKPIIDESGSLEKEILGLMISSVPVLKDGISNFKITTLTSNNG
jgi:hypothetical protein